MIFINNVSQESGNKTTAPIYFNLFPFYTKIKTSILLRVGNLKQKTLPQVGFFFLIFHFFRYLKPFYINYINSNSITEHITL